MNALKFDIKNLLDALSAESRQVIEFPDGADAKHVRNAAFAVLLGKGLISADAKVGWLGSPSRRKGCTPEEMEYLDRLNRLFSRAKHYYGEDGKKPKEAEQYVSYVRVSTTRQGDSGRGLKVQMDSIKKYVKKTRGKVLQEYTEVRSGRKAPGAALQEAMEFCKTNNATLIVARLDRLSRNLHFVAGLQKDDFKFVIAEHPFATPRQIAELAVRAQYDSVENGEIIKAAMALPPKSKAVQGRQNLSKTMVLSLGERRSVL